MAAEAGASSTRGASAGRVAAAYFAFAFGLSALLAVQAFDSLAWGVSLALGFALVAVGGASWIARRARLGQRSGPLIALASLQLVAVAPELGLRSAGFEHVSGIQFGYPHPRDFWELELDDELFWKLPAGAPMSNSLGFFGPEPAAPKPANVRRLVMLGDSCSQQDHPLAWPEIAAAKLADDGARAWECVNLALSGYSTHQGRIVAERWLAKLEPNVVAIYYGWNDHWLARGESDSRKAPSIAIERLYRASALLQAVRRAAVSLGVANRDEPLAESNRVPLDEYRANLAAIVAFARDAGAQVALVTAPSMHDVAVPRYLLEHRFQRDAQAVVEQHQLYNDAVRELARELGAPLFDLDALLAARADRAELFLEDGIHFSAAGRFAVADAFVEFARERGWASR